MPLSKCAVCDSKKSKVLKEEEAKGLLSILGLKTPFSQIPLLDPLNEIVNKFCFQHGMAYYNFKDLKRRIAFEKKLHDKIFQIAEHPKYDEYQCGLA